MYDAIVLGCGISGMSTARMLTQQGLKVAIVEEYASPGGNHISHDFGPYTFDIGAIFLWGGSDMAKLFPECTHEWVPATYTVERITPSGAVRRYPFDLKHELMGRSPAYIARVAGQVIGQRFRGSRSASAKGFARYYLGDLLLADSGLTNYIERFYGLPIDHIGFDLARRRMRWIQEHGSMRRRAAAAGRKLRIKLKMASPALRGSCFVRPRAGFPAMYRHVVEGLERSGVDVRLGASIKRISQSPDGFEVLTSEGTFRGARLVSTIPVERAAHLIGTTGNAMPRSLPLETLCVRFRGRRNFEASVLYNFHGEGAWKRLTMHSDHHGRVDDYDYFSVETPLLTPDLTPQLCYEDFRRMTAGVGIFEGEMELVGHFRTDYAYPLYDEESQGRRRAALGALHALGVETVGRQGNFDYIPLASEAVRLARRHVDERVAAAAPGAAAP